MAPPTKDEEPKFRFRVNIMPPRRPVNSLFKRLQQPKVEEPLHIIAVPACASETFADVWKHIKERYERNYTAEEVAKGWFHKLQDRDGADIDSHDGVGELGYTIDSPQEDLVLIMLQNDIDRDGSVPETSGLRPAGFSRPELSEEQQQEAKRRKIQEERYGVALEDVDEDTPIESRERSLGPGSPELGAQVNGDDGHKVDADGFAVPLLPGSVSRKRKRTRTTRGDVVPSSMEGENDEDILVQDSQTARNAEKVISETLPNDASTRARIMHSMPADASAGASTSSARAGRAQTTAPSAYEDQGPLHAQRLAALQAPSSKPTPKATSAKPQPRSPPTPVSATSQPFIQQPPESAQRPKPTPPVIQKGQHQLATGREVPEDGLDFDPIEDDDLLQGIAGTANDDPNEEEYGNGLPIQTPVSNAHVSVTSKSGKLPKPKQLLSSTPKSSASASKKHAFTPAKNALERLSGTQGSTSKNPRSQSGALERWTPEEDNFLLQGIREGLGAGEMVKKFKFEGRTPSAVRGRRVVLIKRNPGIENTMSQTTADSEKTPHSATKRRPWSIEEKQIMSRAIAGGYDALEIHANHFPGRSEDSINRIVLSLQDQAWKVASMDSMFPRNGAQLPGWTPKDSCKLKRATEENLPTMVAKNLYFSRWSAQEVQKQLDDYRAQYKTMEAEQVRASHANSAAKRAVFGSSQLPLDSSQLPVNSSPVERSMQARAGRRSSVDAQPRTLAIEVPSSPPQATATKPSSTQAQTKHRPSNQEQRSSSPTVEIPVTEQDTARGNISNPEPNASRKTVSRPSSGNGRQSTLNFLRDKGKKSAGNPRPSTEELNAQYARRTTSISTEGPATQPQESPINAELPEQSRIEDDDGSSDGEHTPADDLEMLNAEIERGSRSHEADRLFENSLASKTQPISGNNAHRDNPMVGRSPEQATLFSDGRRQSASTGMTMQSPMTTSSTSSGRRRRSRVESGVDTRVAAQLSQELNRSLSREEREEREEAAHEDQVFSTPDPKINRYHKTTRARTVTFSEDANTPHDNDATEESQAFQTQDPTTTRSQRASRVSFQSEQSPRSTAPGPPSAQKPTRLQPSPQIGTPESGGARATGPASTPARPGRLPSRGPSYASRIKDIHRPARAVTNATAKIPHESPKKTSTNDAIDHVRDEGSHPPTDAEIWEKAAIAETLGRDRQEYFEDLKLSTFSISAMGRGDWEEVRRLKAEERRLHRERKIARGVYVPSKRDTQHPDGPAQGGDSEQADEDIIRADDVSDASSDIDDDGDEKIWSDADFEQPPEVDQDRHFSEVEDDEVLEEANGQAVKAIGEPENVDHSRHVSEVIDDKEVVDNAQDVDVDDAPEQHPDELALPTVHTLQETNDNAQHALTDDNLQELNNSGAEGSPTRVAGRKRKIREEDSSPKSRRDKQQSHDRTAMPPPVSTGAKDSKRKKRRSRLSNQRASKSGSERSSSFSHAHPSSDAPQQHAPSTPARSDPAYQSKRTRVSETTPAEQTPKASQKLKQAVVAGCQKAPSSSVKSSQRTDASGISGLSGLVRKAHIPTPPKVKRTPLKDNKAKKLDVRVSDDESDESSDSD